MIALARLFERLLNQVLSRVSQEGVFWKFVRVFLVIMIIAAAALIGCLRILRQLGLLTG
jgi:hypothetical protein